MPLHNVKPYDFKRLLCCDALAGSKVFFKRGMFGLRRCIRLLFVPGFPYNALNCQQLPA